MELLNDTGIRRALGRYWGDIPALGQHRYRGRSDSHQNTLFHLPLTYYQSCGILSFFFSRVCCSSFKKKKKNNRHENVLRLPQVKYFFHAIYTVSIEITPFSPEVELLITGCDNDRTNMISCTTTDVL